MIDEENKAMFSLKISNQKELTTYKTVLLDSMSLAKMSVCGWREREGRVSE